MKEENKINIYADWIESENQIGTLYVSSMRGKNIYSFEFDVKVTGLGDGLGERIVLSEKATQETISERANIIAVRKDNINSPKTIALVEACGDQRVATYISNTFGDSVLYHYESLIAHLA